MKSIGALGRGSVCLWQHIIAYVATGSRAFLMAKDSQITQEMDLGAIRQMFISDVPLKHFIWYPAFAFYGKISQGIHSFPRPRTKYSTNTQQTSHKERLHTLSPTLENTSEVPKLLAASSDGSSSVSAMCFSGNAIMAPDVASCTMLTISIRPPCGYIAACFQNRLWRLQREEKAVLCCNTLRLDMLH